MIESIIALVIFSVAAVPILSQAPSVTRDRKHRTDHFAQHIEDAMRRR